MSTMTTDTARAVLSDSLRRPVCQTYHGCIEHVRHMPDDRWFVVCMYCGVTPDTLAKHIWELHKHQSKGGRNAT